MARFAEGGQPRPSTQSGVAIELGSGMRDVALDRA
jgi:hypothetical protein